MWSSSRRLDGAPTEPNSGSEDEVIKTLGAFMSGHRGRLVFGVEDDGNGLGIEKDLSTVQGKSPDGFDLWIQEMLDDAIGKPEVANLVAISSVEVEEKVLCRVDVKASDRPVYAKTAKDSEVFFVRSGASSKRPGTKGPHDYIAGHLGIELTSTPGVRQSLHLAVVFAEPFSRNDS